MKFIQKIARSIMVVAMIMLAPLPYVANAQTVTPIKTLVLYDAPANVEFSKLGLAYAIMLRNLLGHFDTTVDLLPVHQYTTGKMLNYKATFYLGSYYDNTLPTTFLTDAAKKQTTLVWFKYNLWSMAWNASYNFNQNFGFNFLSLRGLDGTPSTSSPTPGFFDTVLYKNQSLVKYYVYNPATNTAHADPDIGVTSILDATKAKSLVNIKNSKSNEQLPYVIRSGNFWYFADLPFSYIGPRDRYLVICDLLHDILGVNTPETHKAMVRLEDVSILTQDAALKTLSDYLKTKNIPFSIALIPFYRDPLGRYNNNVPQEVKLSQATALKSSLNYAMTKGAKIVMHGYTHQYASMANPHTGVSGDDYEFWDIINNRPVNEDATTWINQRLDTGLADLKANGYTPFAWEAPHYHGSPLSSKAAAAKFAKTYQRVVYFTADKPQLNISGAGRDFAVGQFFPYFIKKDYYGQKIIPENLGNIEYNICEVDTSSCLEYSWQDLYKNAQYAKVVRDGVASFFFHPFWLDPAVNKPGFADFKSLVEGISALGYQWVDASTYQ